jgi:prepilin-type processing-associated H-X9-DG protein
MWVGSWPLADDAVPDDLTGDGGYGAIGSPSYPHGAGYFMGRFCIDRHKQAINVGFVDSHVARVPLEELWTLLWHHGFIGDYDVTLP